MSLTPQITLTVKLYDYQGNVIGSSSAPAYLRIALCGYGQTLPCIPGTGMVGGLGGDIPFVGSTLNVLLWGNDVITPAGTYYAISILDASKNVVQSGIYKFTGTQTIDLSNATQIVQPSIAPPAASETSQTWTTAAGLTGLTLATVPRAGTLVKLFRNRLLQVPTNDYTISGASITFNGFTSNNGDVFYALYYQAA